MAVSLYRILNFSFTLCLFIVVVYGKPAKLTSDFRLRRFSDKEYEFLDKKGSIEDFANNVLCRHLEGQKHLQEALKSRLPELKESVLTMFASQLCAEKGILLEMWVGELFDTDGDNILNHFEMNNYKPGK